MQSETLSSVHWPTVAPKYHLLDGGQGRTNLFDAATGDKTAMWLFRQLFDHLLE